MGGFNPPVPQQDSNWEIRVAVQVSLLLQILLIFVGPKRKRSSHPVPRFTVWSCYLLADWVADLALGLLLNNMGSIGGGGGGSSGSSFGLNKRGGGGGGGGPAGNNNSGDSSSSSPIIFAFWTPFLLLHLGGPDTITAYSLEDNELWLRHLIGLLFELFSASVIFFCSLHGNPMIHATVLMFVAGIIKYAERTYSLYSGSVDGFRDKILDPPDPGPNYAKLMTEFDSKYKAGLDVQILIANGEAEEAHKEMETAETKRLVLESTKSVEARAYEFFLIFRRLFVNLILSFKERRLSQAFFLERDDLTPPEAFEVIEVELNFIYDMVYTKAPVAHRKIGWALRSVCSGCLVSALLIFFFLDKPGHQIQHVDVGITYALLLGGLALDAAALLMLLFSDRARVFLEQQSQSQSQFRFRRQLSKCLLRLIKAMTKRSRTPRWSGKTSQLNLIHYCLEKLEHNSRIGRCCRCLLKVADKVGLEEIFIKRVPVTKQKASCWMRCAKLFPPPCGKKSGEESDILNFIFDGLKKTASDLKSKVEEEEKEEKKEDIMEVCNRRGKTSIDYLEKEMKKRDEEMKKRDEEMKKRDEEMKKRDEEKLMKERDEEKLNVIRDSVVRRDFDESLLLWHIATDLCRHGLKDEQKVAARKETWLRPIGETLSEYMLYLLIKQPEMLSATAGIGLLRYRDTCSEAQRFFASMDEWIASPQDAWEMLLKVNTSQKPSVVKGDRSKSVLFDAVILAKALRELKDDELMWEVITGVWREMLTYAAGKCRGSTHVRQLSRGGELITLVWFLMAHMGLGDMYQIQEGDAKAKLIVNDQ